LEIRAEGDFLQNDDAPAQVRGSKNEIKQNLPILTCDDPRTHFPTE